MPREADEMFQFAKFEGKPEAVGFLIHSFSTFDRVKKWDVNTNTQDAKKPYSIEVGKSKRTINLHVIATTKFETTAQNTSYPLALV